MGVMLDGEPLDRRRDRRPCSLAPRTWCCCAANGWRSIGRGFERTMEQFRAAEELAARDGLSFAEAMRMLAGAAVTRDDRAATDTDWSRVTAGPWLEQTLKELRAPDGDGVDPGPALQGRCGLISKRARDGCICCPALASAPAWPTTWVSGKTIQVLALLLVEQARDTGPPAEPAGGAGVAAGNWAAEIEKFAPGLKAVIVHPSAMPADEIKQFTPEQASDYDLAITSYGSLLRIPAFAETDWRFVILDEAQAIKNPNARQTRAAKALKAKARIALTGTPVENHLGDLWSIFDFINPGLLGNAKQFSRYTKGLAERTQNPYGPLRELVRPYILRRMKTDKSIIADLPDKTEIKALCGLAAGRRHYMARRSRTWRRALRNPTAFSARASCWRC